MSGASFSILLLFQRLNAAELLRLFIDFDLLEEAVALALEYLDAASGKGREYFGLKVSALRKFAIPQLV